MDTKDLMPVAHEPVEGKTREAGVFKYRLIMTAESRFAILPWFPHELCWNFFKK